MLWQPKFKSVMAVLCVALVTVTAGLGAETDATEKKLIAVGWDMPNAERLLRDVEVMDESPFRGTSLRFSGRGGDPFLDFAHNRDIWKQEDIDEIIEDLAATEPERMTECFLDIKATPGLDWFDDDGWAIIVDHWRTAAIVAREGGIPGLLFDPESYREPQFSYLDQQHSDEHTFEEYSQMARQRGREVMRAVTEEYPDITIFSLFMLSIIPDTTRPMSDVLPNHKYGLYPAFIDGWLDAITEGVTLIDGCEHAYKFNSEVAYLYAANRIRNSCQRLVSPENRYKYRAQVQVSFGVYLDAYVNPPDSTWYIDPGDQTAVQRLSDNLLSALNAADEYVWVYGEHGHWWPTTHPDAGKQHWAERLPGIEDMLWAVTDSEEYAAHVIDNASQNASNLLTNGDFSAETGEAPEGPQAADWERENAPAGWSFWQSASAGSEGYPGWDREVGHDGLGAGILRDVRMGCLIQSVEVSPGERYAVEIWYRQQGEGSPSTRVRWQRPDGAWHAQHRDRYLSSHGADGEWQRMIGVVTVPEGAGHLILLPWVDGQLSDQDVVWWDDAAVFPAD